MIVVKFTIPKIMVRLNYWKVKLSEGPAFFKLFPWEVATSKGSLLLLRCCKKTHEPSCLPATLKMLNINVQLPKIILLTSVLFWTLVISNLILSFHPTRDIFKRPELRPDFPFLFVCLCEGHMLT